MSTETSNSETLFGHPKGLVVLFFTEMWERFSYYGMRGLFVLYLVANIDEGGFGWTTVEALSLYGTYTMMVYLMSIPGGILADKFVGQKKAVMIGGFLLVAGHGIMAIPGQSYFFLAITLIVLGVGALKANISTMVGGLYRKGDIRRDKGFVIFYMGINLGSVLAGLIVGWVGQVYGWHYGFGLAGIGMLFGQIQFLAGQKYLKDVGNFIKPEVAVTDNSVNHFDRLLKAPLVLGFTIIIAALGIYFGYVGFSTANWSYVLYGVLIALAGPAMGMGINIYRLELDSKERDRIVVLLVSFLIVIAFWGAFEQAGGLMNLFAENKTNKLIFGLWEAKASQFQSLNPAFIVIFGILVANFWIQRRKSNKEESAIFKMAVGNIIMGLGFIVMFQASKLAGPDGQVSYWWLVIAYLLHTIGELSSSPVALSFVTKLAPIRYGSIMMGLYFAMTGLGNKVAGLLGESSADYGETQVYAGIAIFSVTFGLLLLILLKKLKKLTHGAEDIVLEGGH
jgi:proton-dependent oligopeptide transporter, POT family